MIAMLKVFDQTDSSLVARATDNATGVKVRARVVEAAMTPRDYINWYLDEHLEAEQRIESDPDYGYRELAAEISDHFEMDFDHTTVYRAVQKRKETA